MYVREGALLHHRGVPDVSDDEDEVEARQDGCHQINVLGRALEVIVAAVDRVSRRENRRSTDISKTHGRARGGAGSVLMI